MIRRELSERRACQLLGISRRWRRYQSRRRDQDLAEALLELALRHPRFGYRRLHQMVLRQGRRENVKRVRRLCRKLGLTLPARRKKKRRGKGIGMPVKAEYPNHVWAYDFVFDQCENGKQLKMLTVEDEFTRESLAIEVDHRMGAARVSRVLLRLMDQRTRPAFVRSDNGPEFIAKALLRMLAARGVVCQHIEPGSPWQNGKSERFNGTFRSECTEMETFHHRDHARAVAELFRRYYNHERPHSALGYQTPEEFARRHPLPAACSAEMTSNAPPPAAGRGCRGVRSSSQTTIRRSF